MLNPFHCPYNPEDFIDVPEPSSHTQCLRLSFSKHDQLAQNKALRQALQGVSAFRLRISPDGRTLLLDPEGPCNLTFSKRGTRTHHRLGEMLKEQGLEPPISYRVIWAEGFHCWAAQYNGLTPPPALGARTASPSRRRKRREG